MQTLTGIIGLAVIIGIVILLRKGTRSLNRWSNRNVFSKGQYSEQQRLTSTCWVFTAAAPITEIKSKLNNYVTSVTAPPKVVGAIFIAEDSANKIVYRLGNSFATTFTAVLTFSQTDNRTTAQLSIVNWMEQGGIALGIDKMNALIASVKDAFGAADANMGVKEIAK